LTLRRIADTEIPDNIIIHPIDTAAKCEPMSIVTVLGVINEASEAVTRQSKMYEGQVYHQRNLIVYDQTECLPVKLIGDADITLFGKDVSALQGHPILLRNLQTALSATGEVELRNTCRTVICLDPIHLPQTASLMAWATKPEVSTEPVPAGSTQ
jgi:hypothetical protein